MQYDVLTPDKKAVGRFDSLDGEIQSPGGN